MGVSATGAAPRRGRPGGGRERILDVACELISADGMDEVRVARLAEEEPDVAEVLLDPVLVGERGVTVLHAGVRLLPPEEDLERGPRRLVGESAALLR